MNCLLLFPLFDITTKCSKYNSKHQKYCHDSPYINVINYLFPLLCVEDVLELIFIKVLYCKAHRHDRCSVFCLTDIVNCRGLALDWLSRNLYWLSSENDESQINVARFDGSLKTSIIHGIDKPRCLVVHPAKG